VLPFFTTRPSGAPKKVAGQATSNNKGRPATTIFLPTLTELEFVTNKNWVAGQATTKNKEPLTLL